MAINSLATAQHYSAELDKVFEQKAVTGFFADNVLRAKFVGAKTVIIPSMDFVGLTDYDRDAGFTNGAVTISQESHNLSMDRARSLQIDREDMDETGVAGLAGQVLGEYVRTKVVPECDAYVLSALAKIASDESQTEPWNASKPYEVFTKMMLAVQDKAGYDAELVCFVDHNAYGALMNSPEFTRSVTVSDFKQGGVDLKVKSINGVALIPVSSARMKSAYTFVKSEAGGFTPDLSAKNVRMLMLPKKAAHLVKKSERMRIWTPEQNIDADAYKFDYRIYYDVLVNNSNKDSIYASVTE
jgi:hypothetical protein